MKTDLEEAAKEYANENCWIPEELHDSEIPDYIEHFAKHFLAGAEWQEKQCKDAFFNFFRSHCKYAVTEFNCHMYREDVACCIENCDLFKQFTLGEG